VTTPPEAPAAEALSIEEMTMALNAAALVTGSEFDAAAMHLLTFTELPGRKDFARLHVEMSMEELAGKTIPVAWIRDWHKLAGDAPGVYMTGGCQRLVAIAASWARGIPVDLRENASHMLGHAHARRVIEAMIIGSGRRGMFELAPQPAS
jgi:hypothetical protein